MTISTKAELITAIARNQKIRAIKLVRELCGYGLKEAKDFVETAAAADFPSDYNKPYVAWLPPGH